MKAAARRIVERRAGYRCEYCHLHQDDYHLAYHVEHVIARQHGGSDRLANLCFSCPECNFAKGPNVAGYWHGRVVPLFNPRRQLWSRHFCWDGPRLVGKTLAEKVTVKLLNINGKDRIRLRTFLVAEGRHPQAGDPAS
jgi:hypothetical protein